MKPEEQNAEFILEKALSEMREEPNPAIIEAAAGRVWQKIAAEQAAAGHTEKIRSCADFQAMIPAYRAGELPEARTLLLKDHTHECVGCRRALEAASGKVSPFVVRKPQKRTPWFAQPAWRFAMAACLMIAIGLGAWSVWFFGGSPVGSRVTVQVADGTLFQVAGDRSMAVAAGAELEPGAMIRTAKDSTAVLRLRDGSLVEMRERSGLSVMETRRDLDVKLDRGSVIVQAAKQRSGHLYVTTRDASVSVTGTIFAVNSGVKGSRVSVVEGEVHVTRGEQKHVLHSGDQVATSASMTPTTVEDEIAWSRNFDQYLAVLKEFSSLRKNLEVVRLPELRYSSKLIGRLPADTVVYASAPNLGDTLSEVHQVFVRKLDESPVLKQWWQEKGEGEKGRANLDMVVSEIKAFSEYLGEEIVITASLDAQGKIGAGVLLAELRRPGFREFAQQEIAKFAANATDEIRFVDSVAAIAPIERGLIVLVMPDMVAISPNAAALQKVAGALGGQAPGFAGTPFYSRVEQTYRSGAGMILAADMGSMNMKFGPQNGSQPAPSTGLENLKYLVVEQKETSTRADLRASVTFSGVRTGVASWLAAPAPIGALDFISPEASAVSAFAIKSPGAVLDELLFSNATMRDALAQAEAKTGVNLRNDLAGPIGGEFAFALDGPALPTPSWKLVVEVYNPANLQAGIEKLVRAANVEVEKAGKGSIQLSSEVIGGRQWYSIINPIAQPLTEAHYTFVDGYLVAAPNRALIEKALQYRATGYTLPRSEQFVTLLPRDQYANFSGVVYHNLGATLQAVAGLAGSVNLTPEQRKAVDELTSDIKPALITLYGEQQGIALAGSGKMMSLRNLLTMPGQAALMQMMRGPRQKTGTQTN